MTNQDKISIIITLVVGFLAGAYLYVTGFATTFELPDASTEDVYLEFMLVGESYGACEKENNCLSFQLLENGSFRALLDDVEGKNPLVNEGSIKFSLRRELLNSLTPEALVLDARESANAICKFGDDGTNFRFHITRDGAEYLIDTCTTKINYEGKSWSALAKLWNHFSTVEFDRE